MDQNGRISNWVFVTGVIRSGTTFVGDILSHGIHVDYIHEPFHGAYTQPDGKELLPRYVPTDQRVEGIDEYNAQLDRLFQYQISMRSAKYDRDPIVRKVTKALVGSRGPFYLRIARLNPFSTACVLKDPVARVVTGHLYRRYGVKPVVVIKHPVSLAASLQRVSWFPEIEEFRSDAILRRDFFSDEDEFFSRAWPNRLIESMAHWRATYKMLLDEADRYGDWHIVVHEELSANPIEEFEKLYNSLDLTWTRSVERKVARLTSDASPAERSGRVQDFRRDSSKIFEHRREMIPRETRAEIFDIVKDVALRIYSRESFDIDDS